MRFLVGCSTLYLDVLVFQPGHKSHCTLCIVHVFCLDEDRDTVIETCWQLWTEKSVNQSPSFALVGTQEHLDIMYTCCFKVCVRVFFALLFALLFYYELY